MEDLGEVGVLAHPVAAAADVDDMAVMQQAIDERSGHDLVAQDLAPLLEAFIGAAAMARLIARCVLPTPGGPRKITFSLRSKKPSSWSESICSRLIEGWKLKSKSSRVLMPGSRLERIAA